MILIIPILIVTLLALSPVLASILTFSPQWKSYKRIYSELPYYPIDKIPDHDDDYGQWWLADSSFIWFEHENHFKLSEEVYLHNFILVWLDPYSFYWLRKFQKYAKKNLLPKRPTTL